MARPVVYVDLDPHLHAWVVAVREETDIPSTKLVRRLLAEHLHEHYPHLEPKESTDGTHGS